jgi:oxygen-independent coproporphyrinogen-3 oxidase
MAAGEDVPFPTRLAGLGLYLHVPFCRKLCPFCPYNRFVYQPESFARYQRAAHEEIELYSAHLGGSRITSLYIGGGTPTVDLPGLLQIVRHLKSNFDPIPDICIELHPAFMDDQCLEALRKAGVTMLSIGVESTSDRLLQRIGRSHDGATALNAVGRARAQGFAAINVDLMFALPGQTQAEWEIDVARVLEAGADQLSTYPLFCFPCSELGRQRGVSHMRQPPARRVLEMLQATDRLAGIHGLARCAVWSWIADGRKKFSSVTRHYYVGFGPSASSMIGSHFYVNTFDVDAYASALPARRPIALSMQMDQRLEMAYWLYWRAYELFVADADFHDLFGADRSITELFGPSFTPFLAAGLMEQQADGYRITDAGAFWIHRIQNEYSLNHINRLWGRCRQTPWPQEVVL